MTRAIARQALHPGRLVRLYGLAVGIALVLEGGFYLVSDQLRAVLPSLSSLFGPIDVAHNALHVVWGIVILALLATRRSAVRAPLVVLVFGVFYTALAIAGVVVKAPFGLQLGPGENAFHFTVGPIALVLGIWSSAELLPTRRSSEKTSW